MDSSEEVSMRRSVAVYDAVLLTITYVDITMQLYVILVMLAATPEKMRQYRFFMLLYTLCDLSFAVLVGIVLHPVPMLQAPCSAWRGIFQALDRDSARIGWSVALFCGTAILSAQDLCIIYRALVVFQEGRHLKMLLTKKAKIIAVCAILSLCTVNAVVGFFMATLGETSTPIICVLLPFLLLLLFMSVLIDYSEVPGMACFTFFSLFPLINAALTIVFVKPYRDFTFQLLTNSARKVGGQRRVVFWVSTPDARGQNRSSISVL